MTEFEYKTISIDSKEIEHSEKALPDKLNHYGKESHSPMDTYRRWRIAYCKPRHTVIILGGQND